MWPFILRKVNGKSMVPSLNSGNLIVGLKWFNKIKVGDVLIIKHLGREKVKRLSKINNKGLYVLSDNKNDSTDSRDFGYIEIDNVLAKVIWPRL